MFCPGHEIKLPFLISWRKVLGDGPKQQPWMYWISSFLVLSIVMIAWGLLRIGLTIGMHHEPY